MEIIKLDDGFKLVFGGGKYSKVCYKPQYCENCPLFGKLLIPIDKENYKKVLLVGEGPGNDERFQMKPFTGSAGILLRATEEDTGASEFGIAHTNVLCCEGSGDLDSDELSVAMDLCSSRLWDEIEELDPELIVVAGNMPKAVLLPGERRGIKSIAGALFEEAGWNILPILHPAYVLRSSREYEIFWDQINEIRLFFIEKPGPFRVYMGDAKSIRRLQECNYLVVDVETTSFSPYDTGLLEVNGREYHYGDILSLALSGEENVSYIFTPNAIKRYFQELKELIESKRIVCHNGQFDLPFLYKLGIYPTLHDDTMLMHYSMDENPSHPLKRLSRRYLGLEDWSEKLLEYLPSHSTSYAHIPPRILYRYNGIDAAATDALRRELDKRMTEDDRSVYTKILIPCANMFNNVRHRGVRVDIGRLMELRRKWMKERNELTRSLSELGISNPNSPYQVSDALRAMGIVDYDAVTLKTNLEKLLVKCRDRGDSEGEEFLNLTINYRGTNKALLYLEEIARNTSLLDFCIHPDMKLFGTVTGRITMGSPNLLNYPHNVERSKELRTVFIPHSGNIWGHWDQSGFELRVYAAITGDNKMIESLASGLDLYVEAGWMAHGKEGFEKLNRETSGLTRFMMKSVVLGRLYLRGEESIAEAFGIEVDLAKKWCTTIDNWWPSIPEYRAKREWELNELGEVRNIFGRRRRFPLITGANYHESLSQACNFPVQSTANDLNLLCMLGLYSSGSLGIFPLFPIHDAIEIELDERKADELAEYITHVVSDLPTRELGGGVFASNHMLGNNWGEASVEEF